MGAKLKSEGLLLRPLGMRHLSQILGVWTQPDVRRHLWGDRLIGEERAGVEISRSKKSFRASGFGHWAVRRREKRGLIGSCGLLWIPQSDELEIVYCIDPTHRNQGYATQAAEAVLTYAFDTLHLPLIHGRCARDNIASLRVLEKLGMQGGRSHPHRDCEGSHLSITRDEYCGVQPVGSI